MKIRMMGGDEMAVSAGVLHEVRGEAARKMIQELERPTPAQLAKSQEVRNMVNEYSNIIKRKAK